MSERHKVFVSYHHANDQKYREEFERICSDEIISYSVDLGDIDPNLKTETVRQKIRDEYLRDSTVTVVLVGEETWKRKHVDWEIGMSIRDTEFNPRSGLLGIILPTYPRSRPNEFNPYTIPPRLYDNWKCEPRYAELHGWIANPALIQEWIHEAYLKRKTVIPDNSYSSYANNRTGTSWSY